jgi:UDP-N-acetylglucosamine diphosphorylase/glucosamine-1-phosphate N-acetyltransferase
MHVVIFEGSRWGSLAPLSLTRPVFMLQCGIGTLMDKQVRALNPTRITLWVRPPMEEFCKRVILPKSKIPTRINEPLDDEPALICSARTLHFSKFEAPTDECVAVDEGDVVRMAYAKRAGLTHEDAMHRTARWTSLLQLPHGMPQARLAEHVWDLTHWNEEAIVADSMALRDVKKLPDGGPYHVVDRDDVLLTGDDVRLGPGCVLDASRGPVVLGRGARVGAGSVLEGPCYVGDYTRIAPLTAIRSGTTIGPACNIGGAVSNSIILGFSDKSFEGYLGDSYVGEWTNLGAGTTTANVKTTYGEISVQIGSKQIKTGRRSMGAIIGDHTKTSIGTRLTPGCYVGCCCMLVGQGLVPRFVPSFSFWSGDVPQRLEIDRFIDVTKRVFDRRDRKWTGIEEGVIRHAAETAPAVEQ